MRIWIVGPPGSGKSTVAEILAARLACPAVHLDEIHWLPGWRMRDPDEFRALVDAATSGDSWVVDGNYQIVRRAFVERADRVVWLDLPLVLCLSRLIPRCLFRALSGELICNGNRESLRETFLTRRSLLWWAITTDRKRRRDFQREFCDPQHPSRRSRQLRSQSLRSQRLRSQREIDDWLGGFLRDS